MMFTPALAFDMLLRVCSDSALPNAGVAHAFDHIFATFAASTPAPASSTWPPSADSMLSDGIDRDHAGRFLRVSTRSAPSVAPTPPSPRALIFCERRGQWKVATQSQEFFKTLQRYYNNAYMDAKKQDAINFFLGYFQPQLGKPVL
ncbi:phosphoinositide phosphatase SAC2-like [Iris pallida]|uniref:Phosphoinositide phosphatase SAC2-like n=1 Tax=Iris pallida TaxID=29817 RepID=A0AAX6FS70_IRIPA|nr:phosphoinositide phosphatase SAC2-like [Iris pallida]KAJ6847356.1 phosphoinositide phosphatase SAC2-like [Iris pallida]